MRTTHSRSECKRPFSPGTLRTGRRGGAVPGPGGRGSERARAGGGVGRTGGADVGAGGGAERGAGAAGGLLRRRGAPARSAAAG